MVNIKKRRKRRGASSNTYLNQILKLGPQERMRIIKGGETALIIKTHRVKGVSKKKGSVFSLRTGHHEWIPTNTCAGILRTNDTWIQIWTTMRTPTWMLILNPIKFNQYAKSQYEKHKTICKKGGTINASQLGLVGHSGGLNYKGIQCTTWQCTWHDELRKIFEFHKDREDYAQYWIDLKKYINMTFLFVADISLPGLAANDLKRVKWDYYISNRGNPPNLNTLYDVGTFIHNQWNNYWMGYLENTIKAYLSM